MKSMTRKDIFDVFICANLRHLRTIACCSLLASACLLLAGCASAMYAIPGYAVYDQYSEQQKIKLSQRLMEEPDIQAWRDQREKIAFSQGDRIYDKDIANTFAAVITAMASLEATVSNTEREAGFISCNGKILPPDLAAALRKERMIAFAQHHNMSAKAAEPSKFFTGAAIASAMEEQTTMTITMAPHQETQTKVKVRFNNIYYPGELERCYEFVWQAIDKQIFVDTGLDK